MIEKHYVEYLFPGMLFAEPVIERVKNKKIVEFKKDCIGFKKFDIIESEAFAYGKKITLKSDRLNEEQFMIGQEVTKENADVLLAGNYIAINNVKINNSKFVLAPTGALYSISDDTNIIDLEEYKNMTIKSKIEDRQQ